MLPVNNRSLISQAAALACALITSACGEPGVGVVTAIVRARFMIRKWRQDPL